MARPAPDTAGVVVPVVPATAEEEVVVCLLA
jgi:hypothetical protein